ncbi:ABC transporter permease [Candidatus Woesearchaeota archaeon]|nr:ABC transporter permease [Candidatus Woesearchaeota archaeon]
MKWYRISALLLKYYYISINRIDRLFDIFFWPVIDLFIWGFAYLYIEQLSNFNLLSMMFGGIILWIFVWKASQDLGTFVLEDFWARNLYNLFSSPIKLSEHIVSIILFAFFRGLVSFLFQFILAYTFYAFNIFQFPLFFLALSILILSLFGMALGLLIVALIFRYGQRIQVIAWSSVWIVQPFSCVFYPLTVLPGWAQNIAIILPSTYVFENLRSFLNQQTVNYMQLFFALLGSVALLLVMAVVLYYSFQHAKKTGLLARGD